jgi:hypothetical protein
MPTARFFTINKPPTLLIPSILIFLSFFIVYALNAYTSVVNHADSAELITAAFHRGMAHPPGYPLYTLLLFLVSHIPVSNPFHLAHLSSAFFQSLNLTLFFLISMGLLKQIFPRINSKIAVCSSVISAAIVGFSFFFFQQATFAEVFALHLLFANVIILLTLFFPHHRQLLFLIMGVAFSHHQTSLLLLPAILYRVILKSRHQPWLRYFFFFFIGVILPYLLGFLFLNPTSPISWQFSPSLSGFLELISRSIYQTNGSPTYLDNPPVQLAWHSINSLLSFVIKNYAPISVILMIIGLITLTIKDRRLLIFFLLLLICTGPLLAIYLKLDQLTPQNLEFYLYTLALTLRQFQLFFYLTAFPIPIGITSALIISHRYAIGTTLAEFKLWIFIIPALIFIPFAFLNTNLRYLPLSKPEFDTQFSESLLQDLPTDSVLIVDSDYAFTLIGAQSVNQLRPDILILPTALHMRWGYLQSILPPQIFRITGLRELVLELTKWGIEQNRPVYSFHLRPELQKQLTLFGYILTPQNFTQRISLNPQTPAPIDSPLLESLNQNPHPLDYWHQYLLASYTHLTTNLNSTASASHQPK